MSSSTKASWPATLAGRLTLWYTLLSTLSFLLVFTVAYFLVGTVLSEQVDDDLVEDIEEFNQLYRQLGYEGMWAEMQREVDADGAANIFFRLFSRQGGVIRQSDDTDWRGIPGIDNLATRLQDQQEPLVQGLDLEDQEYPARTVYGVLEASGGEMILQIAEPLEERAEVLELVAAIMVVSLPLFLLLSVVAGRMMSRRSLRGVEEVTATAIDISNGAINRRVSAADRGEEIERLAATFNSMLDKIQVLIKGMREMTDNIAHDLKSPLARIRGIAETSLTDQSGDPEEQQLAASIIEECDRLLHLINTMLDLSETEAGLTPEMQPLNLSALIRDACELYQVVAHDSDIDLQCHCEQDVHIDGNKQFLQRLIGNLLDNAIKYTPAGGRVSIEQELRGNDVLIKVEDTGPGISAEDLPRIFERFYRCDQSRSKPGSGLGLSLARAIARAHFGSISVDSSRTGGSQFTVRLPRPNG
jgi:signal transduction histidine kinase